MASLIFNWKRVEAESRILKQSSEHRERQFLEPLKCLKMWECLSKARCSRMRVAKFTMEKEENHKLPFLDVLLDNHSNQGIITSVFHKKTYTGLLTNYYSFIPYSYKLGLVRTLVDRVFKINNTWTGFHLDISNLTF